MSKVATIQDTEIQQTAMTSFIERAASDTNVDIDKFERLIALKNSEMAKQAEMAYYSDMALLQSQMPEIPENGKIVVNSVVRSTFARYEDIVKEIKPLFKKYGFSFSCKSEFQNNMLALTGIIAHKLGHTERTTMFLPFDNSGSKNSVQAVGSSVKYGRRYVLSMLLNIATGEDDDGNGAAETISASDAAEIKSDLQKTNSNVVAFCQAVGCENVDAMPAKLIGKARNLIQQKIRSQK